MRLLRPLLLAAPALALLLGGCAAPTVYYWGQYEDLLYASYAAPGAVPPEQQVALMEEDRQKARAENKPLPPGYYAQLGYLYYQSGKPDEARQAFAIEKAQFPESAVLMDRLLASMVAK
jgi:hypothetical protein